MGTTAQKRSESPTDEFYGFMEAAFAHFNNELFDGKLPKCLITVQREKNTMGYFSPDRWSNRNGKKAHEIAINPSYFANHKVIEIFQTLVHEQCHLWQCVYGKQHSRAGYHNKEWADKMEDIGLIPSDSGEAGGKKTGQKMSDYPLEDGLFVNASKRFIESGFSLEWTDRYPARIDSSQIRNSEIETDSSTPISHTSNSYSLLNLHVSDLIKDIIPESVIQQAKSYKAKSTYQCSSCGTKVWGKPGLDIQCNNCNQDFNEI